MRFLTAAGLLVALAAPVSAQSTAPPRSPVAGEGLVNVRVTTRIVVVDREALSRAGLAYVILDHDRVRVRSNGRAPRGRAGVAVGTHGITAFLEAVRDRRWVRSESTQGVLALSGSEALLASTDLTVGRRATRTQGPSLAVIPSVLADGSVHLRVSTRLEDAVSYGWGYVVDGSPAAVDAEVIAGDGEEVLLATSSSVESSREAGLLRWSAGERGRDILVSVTAEVVPR